MSLKIGIVGLPNVGKSTLFSALTRQKVDIQNYPFCTIEPNVGVVPVPDERLAQLTALSHSQKVVPAVIEFVDIAGLVKGAAEGEGLGNKFLTHIRETDAIAEVVRIFEDGDIIHVSETPDPVSDIEVIEYELILKDLETITRRLATAHTDARAKKKGAGEIAVMLEFLQKELERGLLARAALEHFSMSQRETMTTIDRELNLLTAKPILYIFNVSERQIQHHWQPDEKLQQKIGLAPWIAVSAKIEAELSELGDDERREYLASIGLEKSGLDRLIRTAYDTLELITFLTTGEDETRAWTVRADSTAPQAGRTIHSDFEEKFIRAEVIHYKKLLEAGSYARARELGLLRIEGKEYIVQDGDVVEFRV
ncbi:MAG: redox-regulated ATPase YchF [bacterium]|nr:redox-regulated ATPase YchF [bacterium]MDZ4299993.1 redox-regulated ATPase YchF [Candidatus Sungbacteria bacterium]